MQRILVVDDEEIIVNTIAGQLAEQFEAEIYIAYSAVEAMDFLRKMKFSIVITDISMPAVSGLELLDFVKKNWPFCRVIMMTAYSEFQYAYYTLKYDNVDYVLKIDGYEQLAKVVQKNLEHLEREEKLLEYYSKLDDTKASMVSYFREGAADKLFGYNTVIKQKELDMLEVPVSLEKPVLMAVGGLQDNLALAVSRDVFSLTEYVEKNMEIQNIKTTFFDRNGIMTWIFQLGEKGGEEETAIVYIRETFDELSNLVNLKMESKLSVVIFPRFVMPEEIPEIYLRATQVLEQNWGKGCVRMILEQDNGRNNVHPRHLIQWINEYIDVHYMEPISLSSLADLVNYNPTYLSRLYREQTGSTLVEAINRRRVAAAQTLLKESGLKIKDIAASAGFYSVKHFNQVFRRYTGVSAGDYRKAR